MDIQLLVIIFFYILISIVPGIIIYIIFKKYFKGSNSMKSTTQATETILLDEIVARDSNFDINDFRNYVNQVLYILNDAFIEDNRDLLMHIDTKELYSIHKSELDIAKENKRLNMDYYDKKVIGKITITKHKIEAGREEIGLKVWVNLYKISINPETKQIISKPDVATTTPLYMEFVRSEGVRTVKDKTYNIKQCPNCGALIEMNEQGKCIYCGTILVDGEFGWVLNKIESFYLYM